MSTEGGHTFNNPEHEKTPVRGYRIIFDTEQEAQEIVRRFWSSEEYQSEISPNVLEEPSQEITARDRTKVVKGMFKDEKGKFVLIIQGNNQPLSSYAEKWLDTNNLLINYKKI